MELTYKVRGADGKEYGPVKLEQAMAWFREGRMCGSSEVKRNDMEEWVAAEQFEELQPALATAGSAIPARAYPPTPAAVAAAKATTKILAQVKTGASWFFWIAALSLMESVGVMTGVAIKTAFGLGITHRIALAGVEAGGAGKIVVLGLDVLVACAFVLLGVFARMRHVWAFVTGTLFYALDAVVLLFVKDWWGLVIHAIVLLFLFGGLAACRESNQGKTST